MSGAERQGREELSARLRARRAEMETAILTRVRAIADLEEAPAHYLEGLRVATVAAVDYAISAVELGEDRSSPVPTALLAQARLAARSGVDLDTVLRRYVAGYSLLEHYLTEEAEGFNLGRGTLKHILRSQSVLLERLIAAVAEEHRRESGVKLDSTEERRSGQIQRLLDGELLDASDLDYRLEVFHLGVIAAGEGSRGAVKKLASSLDRRLLLAPRGDGSVWAWLGSRNPLEPSELECVTSEVRPESVALALGAEGEGIHGWRMTHRQASATLPVALRRRGRAVCYTDVALIASVLRDEALAESLCRLYLGPLQCERDDGEVARQTLRAYFAADRNASSAAAALGVNRHTVTSRLRTIEDRIGRSLVSCGSALEAALDLEELGYATISSS